MSGNNDTETRAGGQAFPALTGLADLGRGMPRIEWQPQGGMTLLDYFAAKAMQALFDSDAGHSPAEISMIAAESYDMAEAMLRERKARRA